MEFNLQVVIMADGIHYAVIRENKREISDMIPLTSTANTYGELVAVLVSALGGYCEQNQG